MGFLLRALRRGLGHGVVWAGLAGLALGLFAVDMTLGAVLREARLVWQSVEVPATVTGQSSALERSRRGPDTIV